MWRQLQDEEIETEFIEGGLSEGVQVQAQVPVPGP